MPVPIRMPTVGDGMQEGTVVAWPVAPGARVEKGAVVVVIEADKSEVEVESPASGVFRHAYAHAGDTIPCGALLAVLTTSADEPFDPVAYEIDDTTGF